MSKIAELLKLAEKLKEDTKSKIPSSSSEEKTGDGVSKSKQEQVRVSKDFYKNNRVRVSKGKYVEPSVSKDKHGRKNANSFERLPAALGESSSEQIDSATKSIETSPTRDYTKVSNSIMKRAIPEKYFRGLSKHTYDVLYQLTRGAIVPKRTIQLKKDELVRLTGISKDAIKLHIKYLKESGLLKSRPAIGIHAGWEYEILVPEEVEEIEETVQVGVRQSKGKTEQNLPLHTAQNLPPLTHTNTVENKGSYADAKTFFKDNKNDDDKGLDVFARKLAQACEKLTGRGIDAHEAEKWGKLAELLIFELELAARHTAGISSVPAFLTEVLRRRLILQPEERKQSRTGKSDAKKASWVEVGKTVDDMESTYNPETGEYDIKALDEAGKAAALELVGEARAEGGGFLEDLKKWYLPEDWEWLMSELEGKQPDKAQETEQGT